MNKEFAKDISECLTTLEKGGTILYPTDTVWGLGCDPTNENAVNKIIQIKERPANKSFIVLVNSLDMLQHYVSVIDEKIIHFLSLNTKPTTVIYPSAIGFASSVYAADGSVAIRICKDEFCNELIKQIKKPLLSTSANISGEPTPRIFKEIKQSIAQKADYTVYYRKEDDTLASPSSIIRWVNNEIITIRK
ncbi:MAG: L-threonylcarbamoyladenylate synthase [Arachidicoccus sp.]|nr:L-threonylcarbamoyladenylate synthase [Arachidicoccus sp.]